MKMKFPLALIACTLTLTSGSGIQYPPTHYSPAFRYPFPVQQQLLPPGLNFPQSSPLHYKVPAQVASGSFFNAQQGALTHPQLPHTHTPGFLPTNPNYLPQAIAPPTATQHKQPLTPVAPPSPTFYGQPSVAPPGSAFQQTYPSAPLHSPQAPPGAYPSALYPNPGFLPPAPPGATAHKQPPASPGAPQKPSPLSQPKKRPFSVRYTAKPLRKVVQVSPQQGIIPGSIPYSYLVQTPNGPRYATYHRPAALAFKYNAEKVHYKPVEAHGYQVSY